MTARGVTPTALADRLKVKANQPYRWMKDQMPERPMLERIAAALDTTWQWLLVGDLAQETTTTRPGAPAASPDVARLSSHADLGTHYQTQATLLSELAGLRAEVATLKAILAAVDPRALARALAASGVEADALARVLVEPPRPQERPRGSKR